MCETWFSCSWRFSSSGMWHCDTGCAITYVSFHITANAHQKTQHYIPGSLNLQTQYSCLIKVKKHRKKQTITAMLLKHVIKFWFSHLSRPAKCREWQEGWREPGIQHVIVLAHVRHIRLQHAQHGRSLLPCIFGVSSGHPHARLWVQDARTFIHWNVMPPPQLTRHTPVSVKVSNMFLNNSLNSYQTLYSDHFLNILCS